MYYCGYLAQSVSTLGSHDPGGQRLCDTLGTLYKVISIYIIYYIRLYIYVVVIYVIYVSMSTTDTA